MKVLPNLFSPDNPHKSPTLKDVFIFLTGCSEVPPLGFQEAVPRISFSDTDSLPRVSTCALTFILPYSLPNSLEAFKDKMTFAILNSQGFFMDKFEPEVHNGIGLLLYIVIQSYSSIAYNDWIDSL